jgi:hypothetical protein
MKTLPEGREGRRDGTERRGSDEVVIKQNEPIQKPIFCNRIELPHHV